MPLLDNNLKSGSNNSLVEKILEQGQRLRNSMVQSVLNYDPFNTEVLNSYNNSPRRNIETVQSGVNINSKKLHSNSDILRVQRYLGGEDMCINEEMKALETLRSMSPNSLIHSSKNTCKHNDNCDICTEYETKVAGSLVSEDSGSTVDGEKHTARHKLNQNEDKHYNTPVESSRANKNSVEIPSSSREKVPLKDKSEISSKASSTKLKAVKDTFHVNRKLLRFVDSLKINVYSLKLNNAGNRKILATNNINKTYLTSTSTYFVEYTLPDVLTKSNPKSRAKVNSGLNPDKTVRFCSKKLQNGAVYFRQQSVHQLTNINIVDLSTLYLEFKVSYRSVKQRTSLLIGIAKFNLGYLSTNQYFTGEQELVIQNENSPVTLGSLKVAMQFGCDKLYFGKEFIDALTCSKENTNLSESDSIYNEDKSQLKTKSEPNPEKILAAADQNVTEKVHKDPEPILVEKEKPISTVEESPLLYALIFISEVRLLTDLINSYIVCRGFSRDDTVTSKTIYNDFKPVFNLYQIIPVLLNEDFINRLRDNYIIIEVWEKKEGATEKLIGLSKLSTHQLYVAYRNPDIVKHLFKNSNPVLGVDWWEPVTCPISSSETGQLRALVALGSSTQIENLEHTRGIKKEKRPPSLNSEDHYQQESLHYDHKTQNKQSSLVHFDLPEKPDKVKFDKYSSNKICDTNLYTKRPDRINRSTSYDKILGRISSYNKFDSNYFPQYSGRIRRTTSFEKDIDREPAFDYSKDTNKIHRIVSSEDLLNDRRNLSKSSLNSGSNQRIILVSDKYVQEPEVEITPSVTSVNKIVAITNRSKIDVSTQSEIREMDSEKDKTQKDFINSFFELLTARELSHKNKHVENSTNTENFSAENTTRSTLPLVDNKPSTTGSQNDPNMNKLQTNSTFPSNSITDNSSNDISIKNTSDLFESLQKALSVSKTDQNRANFDNEKEISDSFKAHIVIKSALHLPSRKKCKSKKNKMKTKYNEEILPSTYVTFKGLSERDYLITSVVPKSSSPRWDYRCDTLLPSDLLINNQKRLVFKVWRKANGPSLQPNFKTDIVLGFAALDLTVLLSGLPNVQGWFNIVDFSSKCNGQIEISITPLENLSKFKEFKRTNIPEKLRVEKPLVNLPPQKDLDLDQEVPEDSIPSEFLSRALKRKFTELDEITRRLRQRLSAVTNDDSDVSNDDFVDEFERDLNTACVETDQLNFAEKMTINTNEEFKNPDEVASSSKVNNPTDSLSVQVEPLINFNSETGSSENLSEINAPTVQENLTKLDTHLAEGKLKIDSLLEKLSLITTENENQNKSDRSFSSRYVSGCSINQEPETSNQALRDLGIWKPGDIDSDLIFNPQLFQQMFNASLDSTPRLDSLEFISSVHCTTLKNLVDDSTSSGSSKDLQSVSSTSLSENNVSRQAPDGAGNVSND